MKTNLDRIKNDIESLSNCNLTPEDGLTRFSFTEQDRCAREYLKSELAKLNVVVREDAAGTLVARREGTDENGPVIMLGSHFDSVRNGGNFDGPAGVVMALEILRTLEENNVETVYPIEMVAMIEEEGGRFGSGLFASRAMVGRVPKSELYDSYDEHGVSMAQAMSDFGFDPERIDEAKRDPKSIRAFIELHIEQGPVLENEGYEIGVVDHIVGIRQIQVVINGRADHAGTTPMNMRADSLNAAAKVMVRAEELANEVGHGTVATIGHMKIKPGSANVVPSQTIVVIDIRSRAMEYINSVVSGVDELMKSIVAANPDLSYEISDMLNVNPVAMSEEFNKLFHMKAQLLGLSAMTMLSGAGHDAMVMGEVVETGLVFVPSKNGRSHSSLEWTDYEALQKGIELVYESILEIV